MNSDEAAIKSEAARRMPAEWEPHSATWLSWPHNRDTWPGVFDEVEPAFRAIAGALAETEKVHINVRDDAHAKHVESLLAGTVPGGSVEFFSIPTNDAWIRDHGAIFVIDTAQQQIVALDFVYNAWGGKYPPFDLDAAAAGRMAAAAGVAVESIPIVLEGGSIEVNGAGALMTTRQCLLNPNRNPHLTQDAIETQLRAAFGIEEIFWLGDGIEGDDTDGHVDDVTRFFDTRSVVTATESDRADPNFLPLDANRRLLSELRLADGAALNVVELPMPAPRFNQGERLPASYANYYVANDVVLVPAFDCANDDRACGVLQDCFPARRIVPIDCRALVAGLGAIHCLTQQVPAIVARQGIA